MRPIDADELKKNAFRVKDCVFEDELNEFVVSVNAIDHAQTVSDRTEEVLSLQNTIAKLVEGIAENARPEGEWIPLYPRTVGEWEYKCSNCGHRGFMHQHNFCPDCGAKMHEKEAKND